MKRNGKDIVALYAFNFLKNLQFFGAVAVPFYLHRIGLDYRRMFILEMAFSAAMMAFEVPTGIVADRWGRRISLCLGSSFLALGFFMFGIFHAFTLLFAAELICALGMTLVSGADKALLYETMKRSEAPEESTTVFARYEAAGTAGLFISFPLGSLFAGSGIVPYKSALGLVFVATAAALAISGLVVLRVKETAPSPGRAGGVVWIRWLGVQPERHAAPPRDAGRAKPARHRQNAVSFLASSWLALPGRGTPAWTRHRRARHVWDHQPETLPGTHAFSADERAHWRREPRHGAFRHFDDRKGAYSDPLSHYWSCG